MNADFERFNAALAYCPETGVITWKVCHGGGCPKVGEQAGCVTQNGYIEVRLNRKGFKAHRVAWLLTTGDWPKQQVDHINGNRQDNRIANLRDVSRAINCLNKLHVPARNAIGIKGVSQKRGRYKAQIEARNKRHVLGWFDTAEEAGEAYARAVLALHTEGMQ